MQNEIFPHMKSAWPFLCLLLSITKPSLPRISCHSGPVWAKLGSNSFRMSRISCIHISYLPFSSESPQNWKLHGLPGKEHQWQKSLQLRVALLISRFFQPDAICRSKSLVLLTVGVAPRVDSQVVPFALPGAQHTASSLNCATEWKEGCSVQLWQL